MALQSAFAKLTPGKAQRPAYGGKTTIGKGLLAGLSMSAPAPAGPTAAGAGAATATGAGAAPQPSAMPLNPQYGADVNAAQLGLDTTLQQNQAARGQLGSDYGFGVGPGGTVIDDHSNPYSRAAAMQTAYDNRVRGTTNSYAARGQLYAGSTQNAQNENAHQNLMGRDALIRQFMAARTGLDNSDTNARNAFTNATSQAAAANAQYALDHPPDVAATPAPDVAASAAAPAAAGFRTVAGKDSKGAAGVWHIYPNGRRVFVRG